jgi:hypothetical protein
MVKWTIVGTSIPIVELLNETFFVNLNVISRYLDKEYWIFQLINFHPFANDTCLTTTYASKLLGNYPKS